MDFKLNEYVIEMNNLKNHAMEMTTWEDYLGSFLFS